MLLVNIALKINSKSKSLEKGMAGKPMVISAFLIAAFLLNAGLMLAQKTQNTENKADTDLKSSARVNPSTLAMEFSLPFGNYPGRSGNSIPIILNYSSKLWTAKYIGSKKYTSYINEPGGVQNQVIWASNIAAIFSKKSIAGWTSSLQTPMIDFENSDKLYNQDGEAYKFNILAGSSTDSVNCTRGAYLHDQNSTDCPSGQAQIFEQECCDNQHICSTSHTEVCIFADDPPTEFDDTPRNPLNPSATPIPDVRHVVKRLRVVMPDGSSHELRKDDKTHNCDTSSQDCSDADQNTGTYLAVDGSAMRLERGELQTGGTTRDVLHLPNGGRYVFPPVSEAPLNAAGDIPANEFIDRNGNKMTFDWDDQTWTDTMGREIDDPLMNPIPAARPAAGTQTYNVKGINNQNVSYSIEWKKLGDVLEDTQTQLKYKGDDTCQSGTVTSPTPAAASLFESLASPVTEYGGTTKYIGKQRLCNFHASVFNPVVMGKVVLPDGQRYEFKYNEYGEITKISYPTGGYERFEYGLIPVVGSDVDLIYHQTNRGVKKRYVSFNGTSVDQTWNYSIRLGSPSYGYYTVVTEAPDESRTERDLYWSEDSRFGFDDPRSGMAEEERGYDTSGAIRSRTWTKWIVADPRTGGDARAVRDPRPAKRISILFEPGSSQALATSSETVYDSHTDDKFFAHLNPKTVKSTHYLALSSTQAESADFSVIEPLLNNASVASYGETTYKYDANYLKRGFTGLPETTKTLDPANPDPNNPLAKSEIKYDETAYPILSSGTAVGWSDPANDVLIQQCSSQTGQNCALLRGNATTNRTWIKETNLWLETHAQFDNFGNLRKQWGARNDPNVFVETEYSANYHYTYPTKIITPAPDPTNTYGTDQKSEVSMTYDLTTGILLTTTNANDLTTSADDQTTTTEYNDPFFRPTKVIPPNGDGIVETEYGNTPGNIYIKVKKHITGNNWNETLTLLDGLGRVYETQAKDAQKITFIATEFDNMGRVKRSSKPFLQGEEKKWVETVYDSAGRLFEIISPKIAAEPVPAKIKTEYELATIGNQIGRVVISTNQAGKKGRSITNALGQLIRFDEPNDAGDLGSIDNPNQPTYYTYDQLGNLRKVIQGDQTRHFMYDGLGRLIRVKQPEQDVNSSLSLADPITGNSQWTAAFTYDNSGNLISSTDSKGVIINYAYDNLNRLKTRNYTIPQTTDPKKITYPTSNVTFKYDGLLSPVNGQPQSSSGIAKGKLTEVSNGIATTQNTSFDSRGRILANRQIIDGQTFPFLYEYNSNGDLTKQTYPSGRTVTNSFDNSGDLTSVGSQVPNQVSRYYARNFVHNTNGQITRLQLGNGRWETYQFNARDQVTQLGLGTSSTEANLWKVNYDYGRLDQNGAIDVAKNDGNVIKQMITVPGMPNQFVQSYSYDSINRLSEAKETYDSEQKWKQTYQYDRYGNRTGFSEMVGQTATPLNNVNHPNINASNNRFAANQGYEYDYSGNLIQDAENRKFTFDAENKQREVTDLNGNVLATYSYDADGKRVKKTVTNSQEATIFVYDAFGKMVAEYANTPPPNPTISYLTTDVINSVRVITDKFGQVVSRRDFKPFGEELYADPTTDRSVENKYGYGDSIRKKFAGYDRDDETDLDFAEARYYNGKHGRFTAVDPLLASGVSANPQTFNRYVYAGNNPTMRTDPNGTNWCTSRELTLQGSKGGGSRYVNVTAWVNGICTGKSRNVRSHVMEVHLGKYAGKYVALNPYDGYDVQEFDNVKDANSAMTKMKMQAALDFIAGVAEANSLVLELTGATGYVANQDSTPYGMGQRFGTAAGLILSGASLATALPQLAKILSKAGLKSLAAQVRQIAKQGGRLCCFVAGTAIHTDKGLVPIEQIKIGDKVLSYNEKTKQYEYKSVANNFIGIKENIVKIKIRGEKLLTTTTEHPFYVKKTRKARDGLSSDDDEEGEWLTAEELKVGQKVLRPDGLWTRITSIEQSSEPTLVYNLEVEGNHNYFVGEIGVLSHNCDIVAGIKSITKTFVTGQCDSCASAVAQFIKSKGGSGEIITLSGDGLMMSLKANQRVASGGFHQGVLHNGIVYDNIHPDGIPYEEWIKDFIVHTRQGEQVVERAVQITGREAF